MLSSWQHCDRTNRPDGAFKERRIFRRKALRLCYMRAEKEAVSLCRWGLYFQRMCGLPKLSNNILMISKPFVKRSIKVFFNV